MLEVDTPAMTPEEVLKYCHQSQWDVIVLLNAISMQIVWPC